MIWDRYLVGCVRGYEYSQAVDPVLLARAEADVVDMVENELFRGLQDAAHTWGVEIDRRDMMVKHEYVSEFDSVRYRARWRPQTLEVLLVDGPMDGQGYTIAPDKLWTPLEFVQAPSLAEVLRQAEDAPLEQVQYNRVTYYWSGWHETERKWTYSIAT